MWVGLIQSAEGLNRIKADLPKARGNSASGLPLEEVKIPESLAYRPTPSDFGLPKPPQSCDQIP